MPRSAQTRFRITAQSMFSAARIAKTITAPTADAALRLVANELHEAGCYAVDVREVV